MYNIVSNINYKLSHLILSVVTDTRNKHQLIVLSEQFCLKHIHCIMYMNEIQT